MEKRDERKDVLSWLVKESASKAVGREFIRHLFQFDQSNWELALMIGDD